MKKIFALAFVAGLTIVVHAQNVISWNFDVYSTVNPGITPSTNAAGVILASNWNDAYYLNGDANTGTNLMDGSGTRTTLGYTLTYSSGKWTVTGSPTAGAHHPGQDADGAYNKELLNGYMNVGGSSTESISLVGIPYNAYDIYVYFSSDTASRTGVVSCASTTYDFATLGPSEISGTNALLTQTTDTTGANPGADFVQFPNLTGSSQTITTRIPSFGGIAGFQIVSVPAGQASVPADLANKMIYQTTWPPPQLNVVSNALTPRMGWNSWFVVGDATGPSENLITNTATALVAEGLAAAGYRIVTIDCTWIASGRGYRNTNGNLIVDSTRWPDGMKFVADYVHSQGLLMGGYSDIGMSGYGSPPQTGMNAYYQQDANQFAAWTWDFIKIDDHGPGDFDAAAAAIVNNASNRPIALSLSTPQTDGLEFAARIANSFRVNNDIAGLSGSVTWSSILWEFDTAQAGWYAQAPGHFLDPDMLMVGFNGISDLQGRSQFNLWCILGAPLMIGTDVRPGGGNLAPAITATTINTLTNTEVIAVDQDPLCAVGTPIDGGTAVYAKPLGSFTSGQYAVLLLNRSSVTNSFTVNWSDIGLVANSPATVRDLWAHQTLGNFAGSYTATNVPPYGTVMLKVTGTFDWNRPRSYEAESAYNSFSGTTYAVPHNLNFSSGAYATGVGSGLTNALQFNQVCAPSNGLYEADIYYAGSVNRTAQLSVNGGAAANISFPATGGDTNNAGVLAVYVPLLAGTNTLAFSNPASLAPNFDKIVVSQGEPSGLTAAGGDGVVNLSWVAPAGAASFNVYRGTASGEEAAMPLATGLTSPTFADTNVTDGQTYFYTVTAINATLGGESPPSAETSAEPRYATTSFAFTSSIMSNNPTAYWRLNETNGAIFYDSAGSNNATNAGAVASGVAGPRPPDYLGFEITNTAAQFTNAVNNSWLNIPALNLNTNTVTITAWIYPLGSQADYASLLFCRSGSTVAGMNFNSAGTDLGYTWNNDQNTWGWSSGVQPPANEWSLVAVVIQPTGAIVYLLNTNGQESATNTYANPVQAFAGPGTIGTDSYSSAARAFNGVMDEVAVFNHALTPGQIQQLFANGNQLSTVVLGMQKSGANLNLTWPEGTLLSATNLTGPWSRASTAPAPVSASPTNTSMFYRVQLRQ